VNRLDEVLATTRAEGRAALVAYLPVGFPTVEGSIEAVRTLVEAGADVVEVGFPYSDPVLDGPVIQTAATTALAGGVHMADTFRAVEAVARAGAAPVVMSYWNPILHYGVERFAADLAAAGGCGVITPDLIPDEGAAWTAAAEANNLDPIFLVAPSSTEERLTMTTAACRGFVYVVSIMGVTGARSSVSGAAERLVARTRKVTDLPLCVGLGVSTREQAAEVASYADGVIVGSALVSALGSSSSLPEGLASLARTVESLSLGVREGTRG
jgi:tryptophan synthase alpha chain